MIKFFNIKSKEVRVAETEPQVAALWGSSDHSPNASQGQDMGWRLAPEVVVEMRRLKGDFDSIERIAKRFNKGIDEVTETDVLYYISQTNARLQQQVATDEDYTDEYNQEIRRLELERTATEETATTTTTTTESLEQLERRVELEERLAKARATNPDTTTTTTTEVPTSTTTTTKK